MQKIVVIFTLLLFTTAIYPLNNSNKKTKKELLKAYTLKFCGYSLKIAGASVGIFGLTPYVVNVRTRSNFIDDFLKPMFTAMTRLNPHNEHKIAIITLKQIVSNRLLYNTELYRTMSNIEYNVLTGFCIGTGLSIYGVGKFITDRSGF